MKLIIGILMSISLVVVPNDPYYWEQGNISLINVDAVWNLTTGTPDVTVAMIDTGIDIHHEEFAGRLSELSYNAHSDIVGLEHVADTTGHGTSTSGVVYAAMDNNLGMSGIAPHVNLMVVKADLNGSYSPDAVSRGIRYAADNGAHIINMSFGGTVQHTVIRDAVEYAYDMGVIMVAASGNSGNDTLNYPAAFEEVIAVGNVELNKTIYRSSNYGPHIDLVAPGRYIRTTRRNNTYTYSTGTSLSAPHVTGVIALMLSYDPSLTREDVIEALYETAEDLGDEGRDNYYGYGLVDAYGAITYNQSDEVIVEDIVNEEEVIEEEISDEEEVIVEDEVNDETPDEVVEEDIPEEVVEEEIVEEVVNETQDEESQDDVFDEIPNEEIQEPIEEEIVEEEIDTDTPDEIIEEDESSVLPIYYTVRFINHGMTYLEVEYEEGSIIRIPHIRSTRNRVFLGWYDTDNNRLTADSVVTSDSEYYARYSNSDGGRTFMICEYRDDWSSMVFLHHGNQIIHACISAI